MCETKHWMSGAGWCLVLLACILLVAGCGKSKRELLVGTWREHPVGDFTLFADGTCLMGHIKEGKQPGEPLMQGFRNTPCTWTLAGSLLTLTPDIDKTSPHQFEIIKLNETELKYRWFDRQSESIHTRTRVNAPKQQPGG